MDLRRKCEHQSGLTAFHIDFWAFDLDVFSSFVLEGFVKFTKEIDSSRKRNCSKFTGNLKNCDISNSAEKVQQPRQNVRASSAGISRNCGVYVPGKTLSQCGKNVLLLADVSNGTRFLVSPTPCSNHETTLELHHAVIASFKRLVPFRLIRFDKRNHSRAKLTVGNFSLFTFTRYETIKRL